MIRALRAAAFISILILCTFSFVSPALAQGGNVAIANVSAVNIRSGPSATTTILGSVAGGTELAVTGRDASGGWWRVNSPFGVGWVSASTVIFRGSIDSVPVVNEPAGTSAIITVIVDRFPAKVYRNPNRDSFVLGIAPTGVSLAVVGRTPDGNWWQVETNIGMGFINAGEVAFRGTLSAVPSVTDPGPSFDGPTVRVNTDTTVYTQPGGGEVIATLPAGTATPTGGRTADNTWWQVAGIFGIGWIPVNNVSLLGAAANIRITSTATSGEGPAYSGAAFATVIIEADRKIAYNEASFSVPMWDARLGEQGGVVARSFDGLWLQVTMRGYVGWMNFSGISLQGNLANIPAVDTSPAPEANIAIINTHYINIRSGPGVEFQPVGSAPGGTTLTVTGRHPTLPWIRVEGDFGVGWVRIMYIIFRGNWAAVPRVTEPAGQIELPTGVVSIPREVYTSLNPLTSAGTLQPGSYTIVGRTSDFNWALLQTPLGQVWINYYHITLRGIESSIPVVG